MEDVLYTMLLFAQYWYADERNATQRQIVQKLVLAFYFIFSPIALCGWSHNFYFHAAFFMHKGW